jgi:hypothetical protein
MLVVVVVVAQDCNRGVTLALMTVAGEGVGMQTRS